MTAVLHPIMQKAAKQSAAAPTELRPGCGGALSFPIYLPQVFLLKQSVRAEHLGTNAERWPPALCAVHHHPRGLPFVFHHRVIA